MLPLLPKSKQGPVIVTLQVLPTQSQQSTNSISAGSGPLNVGLAPGAASLVNMSPGLARTVPKLQPTTDPALSAGSATSSASVTAHVAAVPQNFMGDIASNYHTEFLLFKLCS